MSGETDVPRTSRPPRKSLRCPAVLTRATGVSFPQRPVHPALACSACAAVRETRQVTQWWYHGPDHHERALGADPPSGQGSAGLGRNEQPARSVVVPARASRCTAAASSDDMLLMRVEYELLST